MQLSLHRCFNHAQREPAARCPECRRYFCRECVSEHESRLLCASCISRLIHPVIPTVSSHRRIWKGLWAMGGAILFLLITYSAGRFMLSMPAQYHEGTIWRPSLFWSHFP